MSPAILPRQAAEYKHMTAAFTTVSAYLAPGRDQAGEKANAPTGT